MTHKERDRRWEIFKFLLPYYGKVLTPQFIRKTSEFIPQIERIHHLIEGIYKPKWSDYALSIATMQENPYADKLTYLPDGRWIIRYSAKAGGKELAVNQGLFNCMRDKEPIIVLEQLSAKASMQGTQYRLMGLGLIENYDPQQDVFFIQHVDFPTLQHVSHGIDEDLVIASVLRSSTLEKFSPFAEEEKAIYKISSQKRGKAFKNIILEQYNYMCAVTGTKYQSDHLVEAQASHIIPVKRRGSDDPRNGLSLSCTAHWAFDHGMFTISDQYEIIVHPKAKLANINKFPILNLHGAPINKPYDENFWPHQEALLWHKEEVFDKFTP